MEQKVETTENEFSDAIEFVAEQIQFTYKNSKHMLNRPPALESLRIKKELEKMGKEDLEGMVNLYISALVKQGLPKEIAEMLDMHYLGEVFRALTSPPAKKK